MQIRGLILKRGWYYYQPPMVDGVRAPRVALRTQDLETAIERMRERQANARQQAAAAPMADLVEKWLRTKAASRDHRSANTTRTARPALKRFLAHFRCAPQAVDVAAIARWKTQLFEEDLSGATIAGYMRYCQSFFSWLRAQGHVYANPFHADLFPQSIPTRRGKVCTKAQRDQLLANCQNRDLRAVLYLGFFTGMRRDEILNLRPEWLVFDESGRLAHIHIQNEAITDSTKDFTIKDADPKIVPVAAPLADFLQGEYGLEGRPFIVAPQYLPGKNTYRWDWKRSWGTYMRSQGMEWVTPHTMRHTFVTLLLSARSPDRPSITHIARWTGTEERTLLKTYAHLLDDPAMINVAN